MRPLYLFKFRRTWLVAGLSFAAASLVAQAQAPATDTFKPSVGQPGKDVVWVPTPQAVVDKMLDMAQVTASDYVIDLGSGDGRTVITAARRGAKAHGIEYNPDMVALSQKNAAAAGVTNRATFAKADLFESDFSAATVITMFLLPDINVRLRPKILDLKPGTRIASNTFTMGVAWDVAGIGAGIFFRGNPGLLTGVLIAPELPLEEVFFLALLCYLTMNVYGGLRSAAQRRARDPGSAP